ncbi:MAG: tail sheath stabilizer and completion protein [Ghiorsea sp.]
MPSATPFYFSTIRKTTIAIATMFNNIHLVRRDTAGNTIHDIKVPLSFAPTPGYWQKEINNAQTSIDTNVADIKIALPRMSFAMTGLQYDQTRQRNPLAMSKMRSSLNTFKYQIQSVPYDFQFQIGVYVDEIEDGLQIIEQILPTFTPDYNMSVKTVPEMNIIEDIRVLLDSVDFDDTYESSFDSQRVISWNLNLTVKGSIYQPITTSPEIQKTVMNVEAVSPTMMSTLKNLSVAVPVVDPVVKSKILAYPGTEIWATKASNYTAISNDYLNINTTSNPVTVTLPPTPVFGNIIALRDMTGNWSTNNAIVSGNGNMIMGSAQNMVLSVSDQTVTFVYNGAEWRVV